MQRRKTSVWTPDTDPRARRQKQENQQPEKESQPQPETQAAQEPKPHMAGRVAGDKPKPKPEVKPSPQPKPVAPDEPKEVTETQAKVKEDKPKASKVRLQSKPKRTRKREPRDQRAIDYFEKQVREKTEIVFIGYEETIDTTIIKRLVFEWVLAVPSGGGVEPTDESDLTHNEKRDKRKKTDFSCCYKQSDALKVLAVMITDLAVANQKLEPIIARKNRYQVSNKMLKMSQASQSSMTVALRTGQVFTGIVDWFTPFDIALILSNGAK